MPSGRAHYRITLADALSAHKRALELGGLDGIANAGLVDSAISRPYTGYYRRIDRKVAALVESMATNHGFADGNKRTTLILMHTLLTKSDYKLVGLPEDGPLEGALEQLILDVVNHKYSMDDLAAWFRARIQKQN